MQSFVQNWDVTCLSMDGQILFVVARIHIWRPL